MKTPPYVARLRQEIGEVRRLQFRFDEALLVGETITSATVVATRISAVGTGAATVSAIAIGPDMSRVSCLVSASAAGTHRIVATATCTTQTLVLYAILEIAPLPT